MGEREAKIGRELKIEELNDMPEDETEIESGNDKYACAETGLPEDDEEQHEEDEKDPLGDADVVKVSGDDEAPIVADESPEPEHHEENDLLDWENLSVGKHCLIKDEILELDDILTEIEEKTLELEGLKRTVGHILSSSFFQAGASAFFLAKEERMAEIIFERMLKDENHTGGRDMEEIYQEMKILQLVQAEVDTIAKDKSSTLVVPFSGVNLPYLEDVMNSSLNSSETMLTPVHSLVLSIIKSGNDDAITDIFTGETKDLMMVKFYSEDIFNIFPN